MQNSHLDRHTLQKLIGQKLIGDQRSGEAGMKVGWKVLGGMAIEEVFPMGSDQNVQRKLNDSGWTALLLTQLGILVGSILLGAILGMAVMYYSLEGQRAAAQGVVVDVTLDATGSLVNGVMTAYVGGGGGAILGAIFGFLFLLFMTPRWLLPKLKRYPWLWQSDSSDE
ncbi:MAG: hypothetical protein ACK56Q_00205 [Pirellulaceae bacterium]